MKNIFLLTVFVAISAISFHTSASVDAEGMPIVYLRGDFNSNGWGVQDQYRFSRSGNVYSFTIDSSNAIGECQFKIADDEWNLVNIGADVNVDASRYVDGIHAGANMKTSGLSDCVISFTYVPGASATTVKFIVDGKEIPKISGMSGTLPVLYINVYADEAHTVFNNEIIRSDLSHKDYFQFAEYWLDLNGCEWLEELGAESVGSEEKPLALQIKARGNWTRIGFAKKPFKLKLDKKQSLLGLSKSKHFAILAHADDNKGYLRNFTGFNLGARIGLPWTPSQQPVEVVINGDYRGLYFLTESIRVDEDRVNIVELADKEEDGKLASGGYIVELDNYEEDDASQIRMEEKRCATGWHNYDLLRITFDTPEVYSDIQRQFVTDQFTAMNNFVGTNDDRLWSYMDLDDAARYYLVEEIVSHTESFHGSTYMFRDYGEGQKWHFSPLWDFGNAFNGHTDDFLYNCDPFGNTWIPSLRENKTFNDKVKQTWLWFMSNEYAGLEDDIDQYATLLGAAAQADYNRWKDERAPSGGQPVADNRDMTRKANEVKSHLRSKTAWLKSQFGDYTAGDFSEPDRDTTPAAPLPQYVSTGLHHIDIDKMEDTAEYFTLQGLHVDHPLPGTIYIVRQGSRSFKAIVR